MKGIRRNQDGLTIITLVSLIAAGVVLVIIAAEFLLLVSSPENLEPEKVPFERSQWRQGNERTRGMMVDDLIERGILSGMDKIEVQKYLGPPLNIDDESVAYLVDISHYLMSEKNPWLYTMIISFDKNTGKVEDIYLTD